jgi:hypothetical protein
LQPPLQIGIKPSKRSLEVASLQLLWCDSTSRRNCFHRKKLLRLLCCSGPLSTLAFRLARAIGRHDGHRSFEHRVIASIMKRCFSVVSRRLLDFDFMPPYYRQLAIGPPGASLPPQSVCMRFINVAHFTGQTAAQFAVNYAAHAAFLSQAEEDF